MRNAMAKGIWKKSLKTGVSAVCGVITGNVLEHGLSSLYDLSKVKNIAVICLATLIFLEARFWNDWANKPEEENENGNGGISSNP
jgi:hypothetical protein